MVHFVGAGPGARDLITLRGMGLIKSADVVIYAGSLVNPELLSYARADCAVYNSAKMHLEEVLEIMIREVQKGRDVVRLHTGDPCLYGAVREQMDRLSGAGIPFDVCPGVSSFCGAAAALEAEYTLPGVSQTVIITRMSGSTAVPEKEALSALASHGSTMVLFLSAGMLPAVEKELCAGAYGPETPCAIVYKATWKDQKVVRCTLHELSAAGGREGIWKTALIVVGEVLGNDYELSRLYDASFTTGFREAVKKSDQDGQPGGC